MALNLSVPRTRLLVRTMRLPGGAMTPVLCDADGQPLPMQTEVAVHVTADGDAQVSVVFQVDGDQVQLVPDILSERQ